MQVKDHVAVVTGAASGLGLATGLCLLQQGAKVVFLDITAVDISRLAEFDNKNYLLLQADILDTKALQACFNTLMARFHRLDIVINCAGIVIAEKLLDKHGRVMALENVERLLHVNVLGTVNVIRLALPHMIEHSEQGEGDIDTSPDAEQGVIINTASIAAIEGQQGQIAYAASKGAIVSMTLPMAKELASLGIRVNAIAPGVMETPMMAAMPEPLQQSLQQQVLYPKRFGQAHEFAQLCLHIIQNAYLNAQLIRLDGGLHMH